MYPKVHKKNATQKKATNFHNYLILSGKNDLFLIF